jgi:ribosomal protein S18 acetylase RimI-like enzyme
MVAARPQHAPTIASWSTTAAEAGMWVSRAEHPFPSDVVAGWWEDDHVTPWVLLDHAGTPVAYGEIWDDEEEDEVELARLIVDPSRRREGAGRRLAAGLVDIARSSGRGACFLRVVPDNEAALALYRASGLVVVDEALMEEWNAAQPVAYVWMQHPSVGADGGSGS